MKKHLIAISVLLGTTLSVCIAAPSQAQDLSISGFISQGIQQAKDTNFVNHDGDPTLAFTEIGINGRYDLSSQVSLNGQLNYLNNGNRYPEGVRIDYLFADWRAVSEDDWSVHMHIGRYKNYHWLYSATRDVPHTRPSNSLPQSIYFDSFRDVSLGSDGVAVLSDWATDYGEWNINWSYGSSPIGSESTKQLLGPLAMGHITQDYVHQASLFWHSVDSNLMLGVNLLDSEFTYDADPQTEPFINGGAINERVSLMAQYQSQYWEVSAEAVRLRSIYNGVLSDDFESDTTSEGGYVQFMYMPTNVFDVLVRLDTYDQNRKDRSGNALQQSSQGQLPKYFAYMDTATLGFRYRLSDNVQLQAEYNRIRGAARLTPIILKDPNATRSEYWTLWSAQLIYWF